MKIDGDEARRIAKLAHIELDDASVDRMAIEMTKILTYVEQLREVDVEGAEIDEAIATPLREDEPHQPLDRDHVARNAPEWRDGFFVVPPVLKNSE